MTITRLVIAVFLALSPLAQSPDRDGRISGHVSTTGEPGQRLARAYVSLIGVDSTTRRLTMTRDDGTFVFDAVGPGAYIVEAGKLPHLATAERIALGPGQVINDLAFRLKRSGVISGHVFDERGQPARQTLVSALRIRYERGGTMATVEAGHSSVTDRFGGFRLHGLAPGAYVVTTAPTGAQPGAARSLTDADVDRAMQGIIDPRPSVLAHPSFPSFNSRPVFVPGVTSADAATVFVIDDGTEHSNVNAHLMTPASAETPALGGVSGVVLGLDGQPVEAEVTVYYGQGTLRLSATATSFNRTRTTGGAFRFNALTPGVLMPGTVRITATVPGQPLQASMDLTLGGERLTDLRLQLQPRQQIVGRATPGGSASTGRAIVVRSHGSSGGETHEMPVLDSGEFRVSLFPGRYIIGSGSSVTINGADMTDRIFEVRHDAPIKSLAVSFADEVQGITGRVINDNGDGVSAVTMIAFSTTETDWFHDARRIAVASPAADGRYQLGDSGATSLPAGEYYLAAVADLSPDEQYNPAFLRSLVGAAIRITLAPGQTVVQDVRVR